MYAYAVKTLNELLFNKQISFFRNFSSNVVYYDRCFKKLKCGFLAVVIFDRFLELSTKPNLCMDFFLPQIYSPSNSPIKVNEIVFANQITIIKPFLSSFLEFGNYFPTRYSIRELKKDNYRNYLYLIPD